MAKQVTDLQTRYKKEIAPALQKQLNIKNAMAVPKMTKVTINTGIGTYIKQHKDPQPVLDNLATLTGQKANINKAKIAVSNFKTRIGNPVGASVTLRGKAMYDFINKLVNVVFPRVRDFRGISPKAFDGRGNYNVGFKEHTVFPEINPDDVTKTHGIQISITTTATNDDEGRALLTAFGFPFKKPSN